MLSPNAKAYIDLVATLINQMLIGVVGLGLLSVTFSYAADLFKRSLEEGKLSFRFLKGNLPLVFKRCWLLMVVTCFAAYLAISYDVFSRSVTQPIQGDPFKEALMVILVLPLDLAQVAVGAALFGILSVEAFPWKMGQNETETSFFRKQSATLLHELRALFTLTGAWHLIVMVWWVVYGVLAEAPHMANNLLTHAIPLALHCGCFRYVNRTLDEKVKPKSWHRRELGMLVAYSIIVLGFYAFRLGEYVEIYVRDPIPTVQQAGPQGN